MPIELTTATSSQLSGIRGALQTPSLINFNTLSGNVSRADFSFEDGRFLIREFEIKGPGLNPNIGAYSRPSNFLSAGTDYSITGFDPVWTYTGLTNLTKLNGVTGRYVFTGRFKKTFTLASNYTSYVISPVYVNINNTLSANRVYCTYRNDGWSGSYNPPGPGGNISRSYNGTAWQIEGFDTLEQAVSTGSSQTFSTNDAFLAPPSRKILLVADYFTTNIQEGLAIKEEEKGVNYFPIQPPLSGWYTVGRNIVIQGFASLQPAASGVCIEPVLSSYNYY